MDFYRVKHNLGYHQFADIINKLSFHNLNFYKNYAKYCCKDLTTANTTASNFLESLFFQVIQRKHILNDRKIDQLGPF